MLHGVAARGTVMVVGVTPPYNGALPQSTVTTAPAGFDRTGIFSAAVLTIVAQRAAAKTTAAARRACLMGGYGNPIVAPAALYGPALRFASLAALRDYALSAGG